MKDKPTYKDTHGVTRVGNFLRKAAEKGEQWAPGLLDIVGTVTGREGLSDLADKIRGNSDIKETDKEVALKLIEKDIIDAQEETKRIIAQYDNEARQSEEVTKRWQADMSSDSWLSKNTRPLIGLMVVGVYLLMAVLDSIDTIKFNIPELHGEILIVLLITVVSGLFGLRTYEKRMNLKYK